MTWKNRVELDALHHKPEKNIHDWLVKPNNLTETIKKTGATFSLELLSQSLDTPFADEINTFSNYSIETSVALIRKVFIKANAQVVIFARVIVPEQTYLNYQDAFNNLGNAAIGNTLLYHNPDVTRTNFEYKALDCEDDTFQELKILHPISATEKLWARQSVFIMPKGRLLIKEVFLNTLPLYPSADQ